MKRIIGRTTFFLCFFSLGLLQTFTVHAFDLIPFGLLGGDKIGIAFLRSTDAARKQEQINKKQQLEKLQTYQEALAVRAKSEQARANERLDAFRKKRERLARGPMGVDINTILTDREKIALGVIESYSELQKLTAEHESQLKLFIGTLDQDELQTNQSENSSNTEVTWAQFKEVQQKLEEQKLQYRNLLEKKDLLSRDGSRLRDQHAMQVKQLGYKLTDFEKKVSSAIDTVVREQYQTLLSLEQGLQTELEQFAQVSQELHERRVMLQADELALQEYVTNETKRRIPQLKERMVFSLQDIDVARQEFTVQKKNSSDICAAIGMELKRVRADKDTLEREREALDAIKAHSDMQEAERERLERHIQLLDQQRILLTYKYELNDDAVSQKGLQLSVVEVMQQRAVDRTGKIVAQNINDWLSKFHQTKQRVATFLEKLEDRAQENRLRTDEHHKAMGLFSTKANTNDSSARIYRDITTIMSKMLLFDQEVSSIIAQQVKQHHTMKYDAAFIISELEGDQRSLNIWQRSDKAVSREDLQRAFNDIKHFVSYLSRATLEALNPIRIGIELYGMPWVDYALLLFLLLFSFVFIWGIRQGLAHLGRSIDRLLYVYQGQVWAIYLTIMRSCVRFLEQHGRGIAIWLFVWLHIVCNFQFLFAGMQPLVSSYTIGLFYILSIPFFLYLSRYAMQEIKLINQRMSFLFFTETLQDKFLLLISSVLYSSSMLLPLRQAFIYYPFSASPALPNVIYGAWTLILSVICLLCFSKQDVLRLIPSQGYFGQSIHSLVMRYYYPVFFFVMGLLILVNPYVGYSNFAVYLALCIPLSVTILYFLVLAHNSIRRYSMFIFIKEDAKEEDEGEDRFEHAKLYYGVFILFSFLGLAVLAFMSITRIWGIDYTFGQLWKGLSQDWVLTIEGAGVHIGFGGLLTLSVFILGAFMISSLFNRFVLSKLFEIFRVEPGAQNTVTRLMHYTIIFLAIVLGLHAIKLGVLGNYVLLALLVGISFGAKDLVADFFAGFWILIERPIEPGNFIQTGTLRGTVQKIAVRATTIRTACNYSVVVPNRKLVADPIINWGGGYYAVGFELTISISYHADPKRAQELIRQVVSSHGLVLRIPSVVVRLEDFGDSGMIYYVRAFVNSRRVREQWDIAGEIRIELIKVLQEHNIGIPYPHLVIQQENAFGLTKDMFDQAVASEEAKTKNK